ncbi:MAG TPA: hypothetical protein VGL93_34985 [Streptosporangiaceae bacterium]
MSGNRPYAFQGKDFAAVTCQFVFNDRERDYTDHNGSKSPCAAADFGNRYSIQTFRVCEDDWGDDTCSGWREPN